MAKYLVKVTYNATDDNPNFAGQTQVYFCGKDGHVDSETVYPYFVKEYGYGRKCDAKRNWYFHNPNDNKFWTRDLEIVEFAC